MAITRERMEAIIRAGEVFYDLFTELYETVETTISKAELRRQRQSPFSCEEWQAQFFHLQSILRRHIHPSHAATIAAEVQFLRTTKYKADYNRNKRAELRIKELCTPTNSTAPKKLKGLGPTDNSVDRPQISNAELRALHSLADGHALATEQDTVLRKLGQDIIQAYAQDQSTNLDIPKPTKDDLDPTPSF